ncbi:UvrD-helicase domain-containing protein [Nocardia sp. NPDC050406]|uniref:UvrD-helicase domain-containing protein n=1 Tax=Nocardia sp. NPDC050406 TaxID=3364318 RepID=UPI00378E256E
MSDDVYRRSYPLTEEQQVVVEQSWDAAVLVTAGAGTGKTHTLVRRLDALVQRDEVKAHEILVLSFSRAAVRELTHRIARHSESARRVRVQTFDAWATSLLMDVNAAGEWRSQPFDDRIAAATTAVERGLADDWYADDLAHIIVDEVQDLVGLRRQMVQTLIARFPNAGLTVVGDSAQAIYSWQARSSKGCAPEPSFFDWLRERFADDLVELRLTRNFRARTPEAATALALGPAVSELSSGDELGRKNAESVYQSLSSRLAAVEPIGSLDDQSVLDDLTHYPDTCAILTRDNGQALLLSEKLRAKGVPHTLKRAATARPAPHWLADLFEYAVTPTVTEDQVKALAAERLGADDTAAQELWRAMRSMERGRGGRRGAVSLDAIRQAIIERRIPDELVPVQADRLVISTIHRAKGLEFDRVIVVRPSKYRRSADNDAAEAARLLYVALTRPRDLLLSIDEVWSKFRMTTKDTRIGRWYIAKPGPKYRLYRGGVEALGDEIDGSRPPESAAPNSASPIQTYIQQRVRPGDPVEFRRGADYSPDERLSPPYVAYHRDQPIGIASEKFRADLHALFKHGPDFVVRSWPMLISGMCVETVETLAGSPALTERAGLGDTGVWRVPRLCGLGAFSGWPAKAKKEGDDA